MSRLSPHCPQLPEATRVWKNEEGVHQLRPLKTAAAWPAEPWRVGGGSLKTVARNLPNLTKTINSEKLNAPCTHALQRKRRRRSRNPDAPAQGQARRGGAAVARKGGSAMPSEEKAPARGASPTADALQRHRGHAALQTRSARGRGRRRRPAPPEASRADAACTCGEEPAGPAARAAPPLAPCSAPNHKRQRDTARSVCDGALREDGKPAGKGGDSPVTGSAQAGRRAARRRAATVARRPSRESEDGEEAAGQSAAPQAAPGERGGAQEPRQQERQADTRGRPPPPETGEQGPGQQWADGKGAPHPPRPKESRTAARRVSFSHPRHPAFPGGLPPKYNQARPCLASRADGIGPVHRGTAVGELLVSDGVIQSKEY